MSEEVAQKPLSRRRGGSLRGTRSRFLGRVVGLCVSNYVNRASRDGLLGLVSRVSEDILALRLTVAARLGYRPVVLPYTSYGSDSQIRILARVLLMSPRAHLRQGATVRGWRTFTSLPVAHARVQVQIAGQEFEVRADDGGVIDQTVCVDTEPGWNAFSMRLVHDLGEDRHVGDAVRAKAYVVAPSDRMGVVSDVDDTVMVTALPRPFLAAWNTFVLDEHARVPTPGMAVFLQRLHVRYAEAPIIYLSTGAWNVAPTLRRFLSRNMYPAGPILLTDWGPTRERWFRSGTEHKRSNLRRLARDFPDIKWVLVGDDGQHDERIYAEFAREHPDNVAVICIRELSTSEAVLAGGRSQHRYANSTPGVPWAYAPDGAGLAEQLVRLGILEPTEV